MIPGKDTCVAVLFLFPVACFKFVNKQVKSLALFVSIANRARKVSGQCSCLYSPGLVHDVISCDEPIVAQLA